MSGCWSSLLDLDQVLSQVQALDQVLDQVVSQVHTLDQILVLDPVPALDLESIFSPPEFHGGLAC